MKEEYSRREAAGIYCSSRHLIQCNKCIVLSRLNTLTIYGLRFSNYSKKAN